MSVQPIETRYNGHLFRSRLEARWAVWLDTLGIKYAYEHQGFNLDGDRYLPDFWLPFPSGPAWPEGTTSVAGYWLEIKPAPLTEKEESLLTKLAMDTKHHAHAFAGDPWPGEFALILCASTYTLRIYKEVCISIRPRCAPVAGAQVPSSSFPLNASGGGGGIA
jgi:hypothetical protein